MKDEALKLALEALKEAQTNNDTMEFHDRKNKAITAIKQALAPPAQPQRTEQEPVVDDFFRMIADRNPKPFPLPQRTWVWLTNEEHQKIIDAHFSAQEMLIAAETKSKEKNGYAEEKNT
jgi:hypothetical protein